MMTTSKQPPDKLENILRAQESMVDHLKIECDAAFGKFDEARDHFGREHPKTEWRWLEFYSLRASHEMAQAMYFIALAIAK
jgi:hypothetical protein